jgi:hypothetical protein
MSIVKGIDPTSSFLQGNRVNLFYRSQAEASVETRAFLLLR